ncbi:MAG TPA: hypothetical protein VIJ84_03315 [Gaiellaceae bacterium]
MTWLVYGLFATAIAVLVAAEWPRLLGRLSRVPFVGRYSARKRRRRRERAHLVLVEDDESDELAEDREAFAESVVRDLERLPTIDDRD